MGARLGLALIAVLLMGAEDLRASDQRVRIEGAGCLVLPVAEQAEARSFDSASEALQHAIDQAAVEGGEVRLASGRYLLDRPVAMRDKVRLAGAGAATELRIAAGHPTGVAIELKRLNNADVADLAVTVAQGAKAKTGVVVDDCGDCQLSNLLLYRLPEYGVLVRGDSFLCRVTDCRLVDCGLAGVRCAHLDENGRGGDYVPNRVSGCVAYGGGYGFECDHALVVNLNDNLVYQSKKAAFFIHSSSNSVLVSGCRTYQIETDAVVVQNSHEINLSSNIFCWHRGAGIVLRGVTWGTVSGNNVIDSGVRDQVRRDGVLIEGATRGVQVTGNAIFNWGGQLPMRYGILETADCENNLITANNINFCTREGVQSEGQGSIAANNLEATDAAYLGMGRRPPFPDFTRDRLEAFLDELQQQYAE